MRLQCFLLHETERARRFMRRISRNQGTCNGRATYHVSRALLDEITVTRDRDGYPRGPVETPQAKAKLAWPPRCSSCGYHFHPGDDAFVDVAPLYRRGDTGELLTIDDAPPGAMWDAWWTYRTVREEFRRTGPDGLYLMVRCPDGHDWAIDSRASNCTLKNDERHRCWVRHGTPPNIHVDKAGLTCDAGAGSIRTPKWHGFLTNGFLQEKR